ncbi:MAG: sigma-70 family RNA polymerase sigma factor, partial [Planctomycetota bacterium]
MTTSDPYPPLDDLRWLERLARSLVRDPNDALDLSQDALLAAERVPGLAGERRRRWLAGTLRNLSARAARSGARRRAREEDAARAERLPSPAELLARTEQHRRLLELVHELPGDYRSPLLLRYFEEAPVARIAEALDLPVRTVHTRLHRGLKLLRERLDADHPRGREGWMTALVPGLVDGPAWTPSPTTPLRALGWGAGAAVASVVLVGLARWDGGGAAPKIGPNRADALAQAVGERGDGDADRAPSGDGVRSLASGQTSLEVAVDSVLVLDADGEPLAGARVSIAPLLGLLLPDAPGLPVRTLVGPAIKHPERTGPDGSVEVPRPAADVLVRGARDGFVTVVSCGWRGPASDAAPFVVMAPAQDFEVRVRDADGLPPTELSARIVLDDAFSARFDRPFRDAHVEFWDGSYADGVLSFASVPRLESASLVVDEPTTGSWRWPLGELPTELWLEPEGASRWTGTLVDADAEPVAGSVFTSSGRRARADASGLFAAFVGPADRVWAVAPGRAPLEIPRTQGLRAASVDLGPVVLRDPAVEIGGVVVDGDGAPRAGLTV